MMGFAVALPILRVTFKVIEVIFMEALWIGGIIKQLSAVGWVERSETHHDQRAILG
jgi:DNA-binding MarR family transcriptional regulator